MRIEPNQWPELGALLDRALDLTGDARADWLTHVRAASPGLAEKLTELLSAEVSADRRNFLSEPNTLSLEGREIGHYTLVRPLGHGGMGSVWLARRTDGRFDGFAAVKLMNLALMSDIGQARFRREGTALARLAHSAIARLLDAGVAPSGQPYLVLEYVDGQRIDTYATSAALTHEQRVTLMLQVLDAVGHAHANLIVHRDLKPSNILVTTDGQVKLLDFGIAKLLHADGDEAATTLTSDGGSALTPDYASPEQVTGDSITTATDVYALGVLLYLLLSGRHPTKGDRTTPADTVRGVLEVEPQRLGLGDLDTIVDKALRKVPTDRYSTVAGFADDLRRYLRHEAVSARPDSFGYRVRKFVRRNRTAVAMATVLSAVLIASTAFALLQARRVAEQRDIALRAARRALAMGELQSVLASDSRGPDGEELTRTDRMKLAENVLVKKFRGEPWLVSEVMSELSMSFGQTEDRTQERAMLTRAADIARAGNAPAQLALAHCSRASSFRMDEQFDSIRLAMTEARAAMARAATAMSADARALCLDATAKEQYVSGNPDSAVILLKRALSAVESEPTSTLKGSMLQELSDMLRLSNRQREAVDVQLRLLDELETTGFGETEEFPLAVNFLDRTLSELGEFRRADSTYSAFIRKSEAVHGPGRVPQMMAFLHGMNKQRLGDVDSADVWIARATVRPSQEGSTMANWLPSVIATIRLEQGRLREARAAAAQLPGGRPGRRATAAVINAMNIRASGDARGALRHLESEMTAIFAATRDTFSLFTIPLVTAAQWRLEAGDARGADSLAQLGWRAAVSDSLAATRSGLAGRADLLRAQAQRVLGDSIRARASATRAVIALANGYGDTNKWTRVARALRDTLSR
jgi:eukaryotic-like serine/threonine-protein kinase